MILSFSQNFGVHTKCPNVIISKENYVTYVTLSFSNLLHVFLVKLHVDRERQGRGGEGNGERRGKGARSEEGRGQ